VSAVTDASLRPATDASAPVTPAAVGPRLTTAAATIGLAALLVSIAFVTGGGVDEIVASSGNTWTEIGLTLLGLLAVAIGIFARPPDGRRFGWGTAGLMGVMFALEATSIAWSVVPDSSWLASGQMLGYLAAFAGAIFLARPYASRWPVARGPGAVGDNAQCLVPAGRGIPAIAGCQRPVRPPAGAVRILERDRAVRGDGGPLLSMAGRPK
jgi:uncharacterized membrane protein